MMSSLCDGAQQVEMSSSVKTINATQDTELQLPSTAAYNLCLNRHHRECCHLFQLKQTKLQIRQVRSLVLCS